MHASCANPQLIRIGLIRHLMAVRHAVEGGTCWRVTAVVTSGAVGWDTPGVGSVGITGQELIDGAIAKTGLDHLGSSHFERFLDAWCTDLSSGRLSESGQRFLARQAARNIETRLRVLDAIRRHPEIEEVRLPPIVRIMGFPRSGTTLLHNLMALHPRARALLRWELVHPLPPPEAASYASDPRIEQTRKALESLRGTELERMHWVEATDPEECSWGFFDLSGLLGRGVSSVAPEWVDAVIEPSVRHSETYEEYRLLIKLLLWRNPPPADGLLILKCPTDSDQIETFLDVFPEAKVVLCHRDPFRTLTSNLRIQEVICGPHLANPTTMNIGAVDDRMLQIHRDFADGMVAAAGAAPDRIASVQYATLMTDPSAAVLTAFEDLSVPADASLIKRAIARLVADQAHGRRAAPAAAYGTYGYSAAGVRADPSMDAYTEAFGVPNENERISAPAR